LRLGALRGFPAERGSGKAAGFGARGEASPLLINKKLYFNVFNNGAG